MQAKLVKALFCIAGLWAAGCAQKLENFSLREIIPAAKQVTFPLSSNPTQKLNILYLGCGNLILERNGAGLISDPFFSNPNFLQLLLGVQSNKKRYAYWQSQIVPSGLKESVNSCIVAHTHYDHTMDLPLIIREKYFPNLNVLFGNSNLQGMLTNFSRVDLTIHPFSEDEIYSPTQDTAYNWVSPSTDIRILPIASHHAPHTKKKLFMNGPFKEQYFKNHLMHPYSRTCAFQWTTGSTYAFLIDFMDGAEISLRVFLQTSASETPYGLPPTAVIKNRPVDLAILCLASAHNVQDYPGYLMKHMGAKKLMLIHWEDFFRKPKYFNDTKIVRLTDLSVVSHRLLSLSLGELKNSVIMPRPGTKIEVTY